MATASLHSVGGADPPNHYGSGFGGDDLALQGLPQNYGCVGRSIPLLYTVEALTLERHSRELQAPTGHAYATEQLNLKSRQRLTGLTQAAATTVEDGENLLERLSEALRKAGFGQAA